MSSGGGEWWTKWTAMRSQQAQKHVRKWRRVFSRTERRSQWPQPELWGGRAPVPLNTHHRPVNEGLILTALQALRDITVMSQSKHTFADAFQFSHSWACVMPQIWRTLLLYRSPHTCVLSRPDAIDTVLNTPSKAHGNYLEYIINAQHEKLFCFWK